MPLSSELSPLESYNSLCDRHLTNYFRSARMRKHLIKSGLIKENGEIRPEPEYRELLMREDQKRALLEIIAQAIVERSLEAERIRQCKVRRTLEEICKLHRVRLMKEERRRREAETLLMNLVPPSPDTCDKQPLSPVKAADRSLLLDEGAFCVPFSDIDDPDIAVMDKQSRLELAKLRRIYDQQRALERKCGQPPYLHLHERRMPNPSLRHPSITTRHKKDSKSYFDTKHDGAHSDVESSCRSNSSSRVDEMRPQSNRGDRMTNDVNITTRFGKKSNLSLIAHQSSVSPELTSNLNPSLSSKNEVTMRHTISASKPHSTRLKRCCTKHVQHKRSRVCGGSVPTNVVPSLVFSVDHGPRAYLVRDVEDPGVRKSSKIGRTDLVCGYTVTSKPPNAGSPQNPVERQQTPIVIPTPVRSRSDDEEDLSVHSSLPPIVEKNIQAKAPCVVSLMFLGCSRRRKLSIPADGRMPDRKREHQGRKRYITVMQQPSGSNTITVFKGHVKPGDSFEFTSKRVHGFPFSLTICIDGAQDSRISTCCEYRYKKQTTIGGKKGHFVYLDARGSVPCFKCQTMFSGRQKKTVRKPRKPVFFNAGDSNGKSYQKTMQPSVGQSECQQVDAGPELMGTDSANWDSNVSRRLAKSMRWECFRPISFNNIPLADEVKLVAAMEQKVLHYGIEHVDADGDEVELLSETHESISQLLPITESENNQSATPLLDSTQLDQVEENEDNYDDEEFLDEDDCTEAEAPSAIILENRLKDVNPPTFKQENSMEPTHDDARDRPNLLRTFVDEDEPTMEKVDALYLDSVVSSSPLKLHSEKYEQLTVIEHTKRPFLMSSETAMSGDAVVQTPVACRFYGTGFSEETPMQDLSSSGTSGASGGSGDRMQLDLLTHGCNFPSQKQYLEDKQRSRRSHSQPKLLSSSELNQCKRSNGCILGSSPYLHLESPTCIAQTPFDCQRPATTRSVTFASALDRSTASYNRLQEFDEDYGRRDAESSVCEQVIPEDMCKELVADQISALPAKKTSFLLPEYTATEVCPSPGSNVPQFTHNHHLPLTENPNDRDDDPNGDSLPLKRSDIADCVVDSCCSELGISLNILLTPTTSTETLASDGEEALDVNDVASETNLISPSIPTGLLGRASKSESEAILVNREASSS